MRLLIMGPQGVGKGTQAALLSTHYDIPAISTGDIFRFNIKNKTPLGLEALSYTDKGELVPDELTNSIVKDRLAQDDAANGWILDGYPRNAAQVEALDAMLAELGQKLDAVVALEASRDVLLERMAKRAKEQGPGADARCWVNMQPWPVVCTTGHGILTCLRCGSCCRTGSQRTGTARSEPSPDAACRGRRRR